jgi:type I restriction-modification system DNA methylase subunit
MRAMPQNTFDFPTPYGVVEVQALSGDEILISSEDIRVNRVAYTIRHYVHKGQRPVTIIPGWFTGHTAYRRKDWLDRPQGHSGPTHTAYAKIRDEVVTPALQAAMRINLAEGGRVSAREHDINRLNREIAELEQKIQDKKLQLADLMADRLNPTTP